MKRTYHCSENLPEMQKPRVLKELTLGYLNLSDEFFVQAQQNFELALAIDKTCADAFWGLALAKLECKNEDELYSHPTVFKEIAQMDECKKALEFASENTRRKYLDLLERINQIYEGENY